MARNVYFDLTRAFNDRGPIVALASGQAVVHYRVAIMSKDGDWVIRETAEACRLEREAMEPRTVVGKCAIIDSNSRRCDGPVDRPQCRRKSSS